jgi:hypothetical protein
LFSEEETDKIYRSEHGVPFGGGFNNFGWKMAEKPFLGIWDGGFVSGSALKCKVSS